MINTESNYFFSSTKIKNFFQQHWESEYLKKKPIPPPPPPPCKLNGRSLIGFRFGLCKPDDGPRSL